jgi:SP family sugar:H+ symporter-like MFS transporter
MLFSTRSDRSAYLIPMGVQAVAPGLMLLSSPFLPESPRWLVWKG